MCEREDWKAAWREALEFVCAGCKLALETRKSIRSITQVKLIVALVEL